MSSSEFLTKLNDPDYWREFLSYRILHQRLSLADEKEFTDFINQKRYLPVASQIQECSFPGEYPIKKTVNKEGVNKKRVVYSFSRDITMVLKLLSYHLYRFDSMLSPNCYAFRQSKSAGAALRHILYHPKYRNMYCYKADIRDYFNSINPIRLMFQLEPIRQLDPGIYEVFRSILTESMVIEHGTEVADAHGAMAGLPIAPFFANWYLKDVDALFYEQGIPYFRYSDDILIFAPSPEELKCYQQMLAEELQKLDLTINAEKESVSAPHEKWEFLGFSYEDGTLDLSGNTLRKTKAKIRRKTHALMRWQRRKGLTPDKAAIGLIHTMNDKFYGDEEEDDFCWKRWFFPYLTTDRGLKEVDHYLQQYIRYCVTGRHNKGNYRISYEQLKAWGYRSLVHEFYEEKHSISPEC